LPGVDQKLGFTRNPLVLLAEPAHNLVSSEATGELKACDSIINTINYTHDDLPPRTGFHHWPRPVRGRSDSRSQPDTSAQTTREGSETEGICCAHSFATHRSEPDWRKAQPNSHTYARDRQRLAEAGRPARQASEELMLVLVIDRRAAVRQDKASQLLS
jgi:hypothetical protein